MSRSGLVILSLYRKCWISNYLIVRVYDRIFRKNGSNSMKTEKRNKKKDVNSAGCMRPFFYVLIPGIFVNLFLGEP